MNAPFAPPNRNQDISPISPGSGSEWSGMNGYVNDAMRYDGGHLGPTIYPRGDSMTPPDSNMMNGLPLNRPFGGFGMDPSQRRRPSESTGSHQSSSRAPSIANSRSSDGTISDQHSRRYRRMETELQQHYVILKVFLKGGAPQPPRPNKARDKLLRLSPVQFHELSTDVFDELQRRQAAAPLPGRAPRQINVPPFLQPRKDFHEKRNQARQKLSSLQTSRFRDLATDVFCELERRFPHFAAPDGRRRDSSRSVSSRNGPGRGPPPRANTSHGESISPGGFPPRSGSMAGGVPQFDNPPSSAGSASSDFGRPMPKQFQSNTITPNKSTMVEDEDDDSNNEEHRSGHRYGSSSDAFGLESAIASSMSDREDFTATSNTTASQDTRMLQEKVTELASSLHRKDDDLAQLKQQLEGKLEEAERLNKSMQDELDKLHADHANMERDLRAQISTAKRESDDGLWKDKHNQLEQEHQTLQQRYQQQQQITEEVSKQGQMFLTEMRAMAEGGGGSFEREDKLQSDVHKLEEEVQEWKARYARVKTQLRNARTASLSVGIARPDVTRYAKDDAFHQADGLVKDVHITKFQIAVDELLLVARSAESARVKESMTAVVMAVRSITIDVDSAGPSKDEEIMKRRLKLKSKVSATANNFITASKNFAASGGISPISLLDAAASHLSAAVVDLVSAVKIRSTSETELDDDNEILPLPERTPEPVNGAGYFNMAQALGRKSFAESEYSALSAPLHAETHNISDGEYINHANGMNGDTGLGIHAGMPVHLHEDDNELAELKIYLENQTDLLVQTIQALVGSIRNEDDMPIVHSHISGIVDIVENVLSAAEGAMEDPSSFQASLYEKAASVVVSLTEGKNKLIEAGSDPKANIDGPSSKTFTQRLPPLAFQIARETKELVSRIESVETGAGDEDFS